MANIIGTNGDDILVGTAAADVIRALNGTNNVHGGAGDDRLVGGNGYDTMDGGLGNDKLFGGDGNDLLIDQDSGNDQLYGQDGDDYLRISHNLVSRAENWVLDGGNGNDTISAGGNPLARISVAGGAGDDQISLGISNRANVDAGSGNDTVTIALGGRNQSITLGSGSDTLKLDDLSDGAILETIQITDFDATQDRVDLIEILRALIDWDETTNPFATGHLRLVQVDNSAVLEVRRHVWRDWQSIVTFQNSDVANFNSQNLGYHPDGSALIGETIFGTNGNDTLVGTNGADVIRALGGTNNVRGGAGDDRLVGGSGYDDMDGELGNDKLFGGDGNDYLRDSFSGNDQLYGQGGDDYLTISHGAGLNESWVLDGGDGNDILYVNSNPVGRVTMVGGAGDDQISVGVFNRVTVDAGSGNDIVTVTLTGRNQTITLGTGNDILMPIAPLYPAVQQIIQVTDFDVARDRLDINSILVALGNWDGTTNPFATGHLRLLQVGTSAILEFSRYGSGDWQGLVEFQNSNAADFDSQSLGYHPDGSALIGKTIIGTNGNDTLVGTHGADVIRALDGINTVNGGAGDDRLVGGNGYDTMDGGLGNDKLFGGNGVDFLTDRSSGNDQLYGQGGDDYLTISRTVSRTESWVLDGGDGNDIIYVGSNSSVRVTIVGGAGDDQISLGAFHRANVDAGSGNDIVAITWGGRNQTISLGAGNDIVSILGSPFGTIHEPARITDFDTAQDRLDLDPILNLLIGWDGASAPFTTGHLRFVQAGVDTLLQIDRDGGGDVWQSFLQFDNVDASTMMTGFGTAAALSADIPLIG